MQTNPIPLYRSLSCKLGARTICAFLLLVPVLQLPCHSATFYVNAAQTNSSPDGTSWATAARTIQDAVDAAADGDEIVVTNGLYATGGRVVYGTITNRVAIYKALTVRSVNGPLATIIEGQASVTTNGDGAVRCAYVGTNALLSGFTLTNGHTRGAGDGYDQSGGGAWCELSSVVSNCTFSGNSAQQVGGGVLYGTLNNCTLSGNSVEQVGGGAFSCNLNYCTLSNNSARMLGGGAYYGTLQNCLVSGNSAEQQGGGAYAASLINCILRANWAFNGGGTYGCKLTNCTVTGNSASYSGGGVSQGTHYNCIVYHNLAKFGPNYDRAVFYYSCIRPLPVPTGPDNIDSDPLLASSSHISDKSPCIGVGSSKYSIGVDTDGEKWLDPPCMGADQLVAGQAEGALTLTITSAYTNVSTGFSVAFAAHNTGPLMTSVWDFGDGSVVSNRAYVSHAWSLPGLYQVRLTGYSDTQRSGVSTTVLVQVEAQKLYFVAGSNSSSVYPYSSWADAATNIQDAIDAGTQIGRLVLVADGLYRTGGRAVYGQMTNRVALTQGVLVRSLNGPSVTLIEGGAAGGTNGDGAIRCVYVGTNALLAGFTLTNGHTRVAGDREKEQSGGGALSELSGEIRNCIFVDNKAGAYGGGAFCGTLDNCLFTRNYCSLSGGGARLAELNNCTLIGNAAQLSSGGVDECTVNNCIVSYNSSANDPNYDFSTALYCNYSCSQPMPWARLGNIGAEPIFVDTNGWSNLRLRANSPCINSGRNAYSSDATDLDGNSRISGGTVDMGAYEFQSPASLISYAWLLNYRLPTDGSADLADSDHDGANNWQEWISWTDPTNASSALRMLSARGSVSGIVATWSSVANRTYSLERATNLSLPSPFCVLRASLIGQNGSTSFTDSNTIGPGPFFYRIRVER